MSAFAGTNAKQRSQVTDLLVPCASKPTFSSRRVVKLRFLNQLRTRDWADNNLPYSISPLEVDDVFAEIDQDHANFPTIV